MSTVPNPRSNQPETAWQKTVRKVQAEPLVPVGAVLTTIFLLSGFRQYLNGNQRNAQMLMRGRVVAQGITVFIMCIGGAYSFKPHNRPKSMEEKMDNLDQQRNMK